MLLSPLDHDILLANVVHVRLLRVDTVLFVAVGCSGYQSSAQDTDGLVLLGGATIRECALVGSGVASVGLDSRWFFSLWHWGH